MKTLFKCLFFTLLILKISNANAYNYIYMLEHNKPDISVCKTNPSNDTHHFQGCGEINMAHYGIKGEPDHITISPNGAYAYIVKNYNVYSCLINDHTGHFEHCTRHKFSSEKYKGTIEDINATNHRIYIQFSSDHKMSMSVICSSEMSECRDLDTSYLKIVKFIRISPDNRYAYLIGEDYINFYDYHRGLIFYTCSILEDGTFDPHACIAKTISKASEFIYLGGDKDIVSISDIAVTKDNRAIYLAVHQDPDDYPDDYDDLFSPADKIKYCQLDHPPSTSDMACVDIKVKASLPDEEHNITPQEKITLDNTGEYAYTLVGDNILSCKIAGFKFKNCQLEYATDNIIKAIAYRSVQNDNSPQIIRLK